MVLYVSHSQTSNQGIHSQKVRLTLNEIITIKKVFRQFFLPHDQLWLFGSRADLAKKGGDIDLYVETTYKSLNDITKSQSQFYATLMMALGEQKIDIVIKYDDTDLLIYQLAKQGVQLL